MPISYDGHMVNNYNIYLEGADEWSPVLNQHLGLLLLHQEAHVEHVLDRLPETAGVDNEPNKKNRVFGK